MIAKMNVLIPMAGNGNRFKSQGYIDPKPLIKFLGKPMIQHVLEHLGLFEFKHIFICQKQHVEDYNLNNLFKSLVSNFEIITLDEVTEGATCSVLKAKDIINDETPLLIVNSDQLLHWDRSTLLEVSDDVDGLIYCFNGVGNKWSYADVDDFGSVVHVEEKKQISDFATAGMYFWKHGKDFVTAAEQMIMKNLRVNNEFYVAPVYNQAIKSGAKIKIEMVNWVDQVGTPEELKEYLENKNIFFNFSDNNASFNFIDSTIVSCTHKSNFRERVIEAFNKFNHLDFTTDQLKLTSFGFLPSFTTHNKNEYLVLNSMEFHISNNTILMISDKKIKSLKSLLNETKYIHSLLTTFKHSVLIFNFYTFTHLNTIANMSKNDDDMILNLFKTNTQFSYMSIK